MGQDDLLAAIAALHAAAVEPDRWPDAFERVSRLMGASGLLIGGLPHHGGHFSLSGHGVDPGFVDMLNGPLASREANPVFSAIPRAPALRPVITSAVLDERTLVSSRVYDEALRPAGVHFSIATVLACDTDRSYALAFGRSAQAGDFNREDAQMLAALSPHFLAAVRSQHLLAQARGEAAILDVLDRGIVMLDDACQPIFLNREVERIMAAQDGLFLSSRGIEASYGQDNSRLQAMLFPAPGELPTMALAINRPSGALAYTLVIASHAGTGNSVTGFSKPISRILFIRDPERLSVPRAKWLSQLFGLTQTEADVAVDIYAGLSTGQISARRNISNNTLKSHLKAVFAKMEVERQSDLVRRIGQVIGDLTEPGK